MTPVSIAFLVLAASGAAFTPHHPVQRFRCSTSLNLVQPSETEKQPFFGPRRSASRTIPIAALVVGLGTYVALGAPGHESEAAARDMGLLKDLLANPLSPNVPPLFSVVFNLMGLWPAWYAATLLPGDKDQTPVPSWPFLAGSVGAGAFALAPYLALREMRDTPATAKSQAELGPVGRWFEGKTNAGLLMTGTLGLLYYGVTANDCDMITSIIQYKELFDHQLFAHVMTLDFLTLWALSFGVLREDASRRGVNKPLETAAKFGLVPLVGHCAYLLTRPPLLR